MNSKYKFSTLLSQICVVLQQKTELVQIVEVQEQEEIRGKVVELNTLFYQIQTRFQLVAWEVENKQLINERQGMLGEDLSSRLIRNME